ncbi:MAG TPA: hypothetical protein GX740_03980 [Acholeplasmataceae bacterium]|jgi:glycopeptide antibiotics resistance protein|nr:hypothetical protein [Acholeplasmataceae bacterium]
MKKTLIKLWGDVVSVKELIFSILIISFTTLTLYFLSPDIDSTDLPMDLFFGLGGAVLGFIITVIIFKPKRVITEEEE